MPDSQRPYAALGTTLMPPQVPFAGAFQLDALLRHPHAADTRWTTAPDKKAKTDQGEHISK